VLADEGVALQIVKDETLEIKEKYGDKRRTQIVQASGDMSMEDLIADDAVVVTISHLGYIKRTSSPNSAPKAAVAWAAAAAPPATRISWSTSSWPPTTTTCSSSPRKGRVLLDARVRYSGRQRGRARAGRSRTWCNWKAGRQGGGLPERHRPEERGVPEQPLRGALCTKKGMIKKTTLEAYSRPRANGIIAVGIREGDELLEAQIHHRQEPHHPGQQGWSCGALRRRRMCVRWAATPAVCAA
jgi:DNA gyrase subunit A